MTNKTNPNDYAFAATSCGEPQQVYQEGLTKREYFASLAMQGYLANTAPSTIIPSPESVARKALQFADALIKELNK
ncbi:MAG: hypothetical protein GY861_18785 [bacterium]|nr:hypothetical protein [bacterium]